jgi:hypothetical protein
LADADVMIPVIVLSQQRLGFIVIQLNEFALNAQATLLFVLDLLQHVLLIQVTLCLVLVLDALMTLTVMIQLPLV